MKNIALILVSAILLFACSSEQKEHKTNSEQSGKLQQASWILGSWSMETPDAVITETWEEKSKLEYTGNSKVINPAGETMFTEKLRLVYENDTIWYLPAVSNQNGAQEVRFKGVSISDKEAVFENLQHDFPQRIVYQKTSDTTMLAYIEGMQDGRMRKEEFPYRKKQ